MNRGVKTYLCSKVIAIFGSHIFTGFAEDGVITIEPRGSGVTTSVGIDGEVARSMDPDSGARIKLSLKQTSPSNEYLENLYEYDRETGEGTAPLMIKDLSGRVIWESSTAWISQKASYTRGKAIAMQEWQFETESTEIH